MNSHQRRICRRNHARMMIFVQKHLQASIQKFIDSTLSDHIATRLEGVTLNIITVDVKF